MYMYMYICSVCICMRVYTDHIFRVPSHEPEINMPPDTIKNT